LDKPSTADKAEGAESKKSGVSKAPASSTGAKRARSGPSDLEAAPAQRAAKPNPLHPAQPILVHPDVKDASDRFTLRLPAPARLRTMELLRCSGELGALFGCYLPSKAQVRSYAWAEVNPALVEHGSLKNAEDRAFATVLIFLAIIQCLLDDLAENV
jgi:hypothetical protein